MLYGYKGIYRIATRLGSMYYGPWIFCWELDVLLFLVVVGWMVLGFSRGVCSMRHNNKNDEDGNKDSRHTSTILCSSSYI